jgi:hypothetical protein
MRKKCKRKVWKLVNPIAHALEGASFMDDKILSPLQLQELNAIDSMVRGTGTIQDWAVLNEMMNLSETMARDGIGIEVLEICQKAEQELISCAKRFEKTGKMGLTGQGIQIMRDLYEFHDLQRKSITRSEYDRAIQKTINMVRGKGKYVTEI